MLQPSPIVVLTLAWLAVSCAGPLVRLSVSPPLTIAFWRLGCVLIPVGIGALLTRQWRQWATLPPRDLILIAGAGVLLAADYWVWNSAIHLGTIASAVTLGSLEPVFSVLLSGLLLREWPARWQRGCIAVAIVGSAIVVSGARHAAAVGHGGRADAPVFLGTTLAIGAAALAAGYYVVGRQVRRRLGLWAYAGLVYAMCWVTLLVLALVGGVPLVPSGPQLHRELLLFALLALGPMLLGTTAKAWSVKHVPAYVVSLVAVGEPVGATILGMVLPGLHEIPPPMTIVGGAVTLCGIAGVLWRPRPAPVWRGAGPALQAGDGGATPDVLEAPLTGQGNAAPPTHGAPGRTAPVRADPAGGTARAR